MLGWSQAALLAGGVAMLGYCAFVVADGWIFQKQERRQLEELLQARKQANTTAGPTAPAASAGATPPVAAHGLIGRIDIPRLSLSVIVIEGTSGTTLRRAVGHIRGTALPGAPGNIGISGHRDTYFRPLRNIRQDDIITLTTVLGEFRYRVVSTKIVSPSDVAVLRASGNEVLTLVTCYPFFFVGAAPSRFIVRAERIT